MRTDATGSFAYALRLNAGINLWVLRQDATSNVLAQRYLLVRWTRPTIAAHVSATRVRAGRTVVVSGTVTRPVRAGEALVYSVVVQRKTATRWVTAGAAQVVRGRFAAKVRMPRGAWSLRVVSVHNAGWATTYGRAFTVTAR